ENGLTQINAGIAQLENGLAQIEAGEMQLAEAQAMLTQQQTTMIFQLSDATTQMLVGESQLNAASSQLEEGLKQYEDGKEAAYKQADLDNIITMDMVSQILFAQNFSMPAGYVTDAGVQYMVNVGDVLADDTEIENLLLVDMDMEGLDPIYLSDVADVFISDNSDSVYANIDGTNGVMLSFTKQSTTPTAAACNNLTEKLDALTEEYEGFHYSTMMNQGDYIYMIINAILKSLLLGALFAVIILFLFLKDIRPTFITLCSIPISVIFAFVLMYFSGITLNMISMSGLAIAVGMLVDNSVVVIENTYRLIHKGETPLRAAVAGAGQVAGAVVSSTLTTICVFVPIIFVEGLTRQIFQDLALTIAYSLLASLAVSLTLVPAMSQGLLKHTKEKKSPIMDRLMIVYEKVLAIALRFKPVTLLIAFALLVMSAFGIIAKGFIFMPEMSTNQVSASITMPEEASFQDMQSVSNLVVDDVKEMDGVVSVGAMAEGTGGGLSIMSMSSMGSGGASEGYSSSLYIMLTEDEKIDTLALAKKIEALGETYDCTIDVDTGSMSSMMSALGGNGVTLYLYGDDSELLQETATKIAKIVDDVPGTEDVSDGMEEATPTYKVVVDKERAMAKGLTVAQVYKELSASMTTEKTATSIIMDTNTYDVVVKEGDEEDTSLRDVRNHKFTVKNQAGEESTVYLKDIADFEESESLPTISRNDQRRYMQISSAIGQGYNVTLVTEDVKEALNRLELPKGMRIEYDGQNEAIMDAMKDLVLMILLGIVLVYLVMVAQFQSLKGPFIIIFTIPLAFTGGFLGLLICNMNISIVSMMGFVMLSGIIVNNGIVLVDFINQLRKEGMEKREAIIEAGKTRMRPILMTTLTTILGLFDIALSREVGSEMMQPVAVVCIGGLSYATLMTLFVVPVIYDIFNRKDIRVVRDEDLILETEEEAEV
nr:efflux RND transporter permease subunit [Lachnospiraceae bacterium]